MYNIFIGKINYCKVLCVLLIRVKEIKEFKYNKDKRKYISFIMRENYLSIL